jgi:hypothetical protein
VKTAHAATLLSLACSLGTLTLRAETSKTSSLSWVVLPGAESCATAPQMSRDVETLLRKPMVASPSQADLSIEGYVGRAGENHWHAVVELRDRNGTSLGKREFEGSGQSCENLARSVALAIALMIDPDAELRAPPSPPRVTQEKGPESPPAAEARSIRIVQPTAEFDLGLGLLPSFAAGVRLGLTISPRHFLDIEAYGGAWGTQTVVAQGGSTDFSLVFGGLLACPLASRNPSGFEIDVCGGAEFGVLQSASGGYASSHTRANGTLDLVVSGRILVPVARFLALEARLEPGVALVRNDFYYTDAGGSQHGLFDRSLFNARVGAGLALTLQ